MATQQREEYFPAFFDLQYIASVASHHAQTSASRGFYFGILPRSSDDGAWCRYRQDSVNYS